MLRAKFSKSIRSRPEWQALGPALVASISYDFQEHNACGWDLALPLAKDGFALDLNVLLLWSSDPATLHQRRLRSLLPNGWQENKAYVIVMVESSTDPGGAIRKLSPLQSGMWDIQPVPILLALSVENILPTVNQYLRELAKRREIKTTPALVPTALVARATTSAQPLNQHDAKILTDICHTLCGLEEATRTVDGRARLVDYMGPAVTRTLVDFWENEWLADQ